MNKIIAVVAVLALAGCAETTNEGAWLIAGGAHGSIGGGGDVASAPAHVVTREIAPREVAARRVQMRREADFVVCAQCRH